MTSQQITIFAILAAMLGLFLWDRLRYDVVALIALLAAVLSGVIKPQLAFSGFSNEVLPLIAGALVVSAAIAKTGVIEALVRRIAPAMRSSDLQVGALVAIVTALSAFMKNIGALAIFVPIALQLARRSGRSGSELLMPLSFGSLLGGLATLIGTSPNILIAEIRSNLEGRPFEMFDFTPVGAGVALCGVLFLAFGWRLLPHRKPPPSPEEQFRIADYTTEAAVPPGSPMAGRTLGELQKLGGEGFTVTAILHGELRHHMPGPEAVLSENDVLVIESDPHRIDSVVKLAKLDLVGSKEVGGEDPRSAPLGVTEAVVTGNSTLVGATPTQLRLRQRHGINLLAVSRRGRRISSRLRRHRFLPGDVIVLQGDADSMPDVLATLGCLPLAERNLRLGKPRQIVLPFLALAGAVMAAATEIVPAGVAFVAAAVFLTITRALTPREVYEAIEWPILVLLGALIPVGEAVRGTGATDLIAGWISAGAQYLPPFGVLALVMLVTMLATPLLHHAAAVIVMGPVAASLAHHFGFRIDPFLMAVAVGAGSDFLSPIGHQCNTLVLGAGGYRFGDYWRLGLPLSTIVVVVGVPLIMLVWPLR